MSQTDYIHQRIAYAEQLADELPAVIKKLAWIASTPDGESVVREIIASAGINAWLTGEHKFKNP